MMKRGVSIVCPSCGRESIAIYVRSWKGQDISKCEHCDYEAWRKDFIIYEGPKGSMSVWLEEVVV